MTDSIWKNGNASTSSVVAAAICALGASSPLAAQGCIGLPSLKAYSANIGLQTRLSEENKALHGMASIGGESLFGTLHVGLTDIPNPDVSPVKVAVGVGKVLPAGTASSVILCPIAEVSYTHGPTTTVLTNHIKFSEITGSAGLAIGRDPGAGAVNAFLPFASASVLVISGRASVAGETDTDTKTGGLLVTGVGLQFASRFVLAPSVQLPVGFSGSNPAFVARLSVGLGKR